MAASLARSDPLDFYLLGFIKSQVYRKSPKSLSELKNAIRQVTRGITPDTCRRVIGEVARRTDLCFLRNGGHIEHVL